MNKIKSFRSFSNMYQTGCGLPERNGELLFFFCHLLLLPPSPSTFFPSSSPLRWPCDLLLRSRPIWEKKYFSFSVTHVKGVGKSQKRFVGDGEGGEQNENKKIKKKKIVFSKMKSIHRREVQFFCFVGGRGVRGRWELPNTIFYFLIGKMSFYSFPGRFVRQFQ